MIDPKHLSTILEKFQKRFTPPQASVEKRVAELICELTPLTVTADQITYSVPSRTISIQVPSILKSELQHHKTAILGRLEKEMGVTNCPKTIYWSSPSSASLFDSESESSVVSVSDVVVLGVVINDPKVASAQLRTPYSQLR